MRDVLILLLAFSVVPLTFLRPHVGILAWCWISYMNPHRLSWGFAYEFPVAMMIGLSTLAAWVLSKEPKKLPINAVSALMLAFVVWMRSEEHTSELQSLMRISSAVFSLIYKIKSTQSSAIHSM